MNFPVNGKKAAQAAARLISRSGHPMDYLRLCKLAYLADRQSIIARGAPIIGGSYFSMLKGPTIGEFMDFVNRRHSAQWNEAVSPRFGNEIRLERSPSFDALAKAELDILDLVVAQHAQETTEELVAWCHANCPEYEEVPANQRKPIQVESILRGAGKTEKRIQKVVAAAREIEEMDALLA